MEDEFTTLQPTLTSPACAAETITPSDTAQLSFAARCLFVGTGGNVAVRMLNGDVVTLNNVNSGVIYPIRITQVLATGTTATGLIGLR